MSKILTHQIHYNTLEPRRLHDSMLDRGSQGRGIDPSHGSPFIYVKVVTCIITKRYKGEMATCLDGSKVRSSTSIPKVAGSNPADYFTFTLVIRKS